MNDLHIDQSVRLLRDIPELELHSGDVGVLCSTWFSPQTAYEVEFQVPGLLGRTRALLLAEQIQGTQDPAEATS